MIALPKKLFHAIEAVLAIAYHASPEPVSSRELARQQDLSPRYLEQMMQKLVRAGMLRSVRGPHGGYVLARERRKLLLGDICDVLQRDEDDDSAMPATALGVKIIAPLWQSVADAAAAQLRATSIADLCQRAADRNIKKIARERADFII